MKNHDQPKKLILSQETLKNLTSQKVRFFADACFITRLHDGCSQTAAK